MTTIALDYSTTRHAISAVPMSRMIRVELRKMFNTRSGFWLIASIGIVALVATVGTILFAPRADLTYYTFAKALGFPMTFILPIIATLAITSEWSQRAGLTTFTLFPDRKKVILAKVASSVLVGIASMLFAFVVGALGNIAGAAITGSSLVWDVSLGQGVNIVLGSVLCLLTGTMLGMLLRHSAAALVSYFVFTLVVPTIFQLLASSQERFQGIRPWVDLNDAESFLFTGTLTSAQWAHIAVTAAIWLMLPALLGLRLVNRSEVH